MTTRRSVIERGPYVAVLVSLATLLWTSCSGSGDPSVGTDEVLDAVADSVSASEPCLGSTTVELKRVLPTKFGGSQIDADCVAWQQFIYLNWQADPARPGLPNPNAPASAFGAPGDTTNTVWESYLEASQVFGGSGTDAVTDWSVQRPPIKPLDRLSKVADSNFQLHKIRQAHINKWLTDQRGNLTFYEIKLNEDEHDYIQSNGLTTAAGQAACAAMKGGLRLPMGTSMDTDCAGQPQTYGQNVGAIELKASWVELPADHSLDKRYKTAVAELTLPDKSTKMVTVGLVGLHIIHKMENANQFVWATFEQIDNAPDDNGGNPGPPSLPPNANQEPRPAYTYYNPSCDPHKDTTYNCKTNAVPGTPCTSSGTSAGCYPYAAPMQITRLFPVSDTANSVTGYAWSLLPADSVFNYYRLIDVQWPSAPFPPAAGSTSPLSSGNITTDVAFLANATLETYVQDQDSCMNCHQYASIATKDDCDTKCLASDYSFVFAVETKP